MLADLGPLLADKGPPLADAGLLLVDAGLVVGTTQVSSVRDRRAPSDDEGSLTVHTSLVRA
jgi:hypothetical protein